MKLKLVFLPGAVATSFTYPFDLVRARLVHAGTAITPLLMAPFKVQNYHEQIMSPSSTPHYNPNAPHRGSQERHCNVAQAAHWSTTSKYRTSFPYYEIVQKDGFFSLFRGLSPTLAGVMPLTGVSFMVLLTP